MRLSVDPNDIGYNEFFYCLHPRAYLDGTEIEGCITADEEQGYIVRYKTPLEERDGDLITETLFGKVEITINKDGRCKS